MRSAPRKLGRVEIGLAVLWTGLLGCGFAALMDHDLRPGESIEAPERRDSEVDPPSTDSNDTTFQLLVFVHPKCPCSRATLENLDPLLSQTGDRLSIQLVLFEPDEEHASWESTLEIAEALSHAHVTAIPDPGGRLAAQYGAVTSGSAVLYDAQGERRFQGGITDSRGHSGESLGLLAISQIVNGGTPNTTSTPVFGCRILISRGPVEPRMRRTVNSQECPRDRERATPEEHGCSTERAK